MCTNIYTDEAVDGGTVSVVVKYRDIITVINKTFKICELTAAVQWSCPIAEGDHKIVITETFPSYAPSVSLLYEEVSIRIYALESEMY